MKNSEVSKILSKLSVCSDARVFCRGHKTIKAAWLACERGDWLLWFAGKLDIDRKVLVFVACQCARLVLKNTTDKRVLKCIEITERWTADNAMIEEMITARRDAADAADAAAYAAYAYAAAYAAYAYAAAAAAAYAAAADAADAAAAYAAYAAAAAADAAAYAAADAADATRKETLKICADLVRKYIPWSVIAAAIKGL